MTPDKLFMLDTRNNDEDGLGASDVVELIAALREAWRELEGARVDASLMSIYAADAMRYGDKDDIKISKRLALQLARAERVVEAAREALGDLQAHDEGHLLIAEQLHEALAAYDSAGEGGEGK